MRKLLATVALATVISTPALATDFTYEDITIASTDWTTLQGAVASYGNESGAARAERLTKEMIDMANAGAAYTARWNKITSVANKEGWGSELQDIVVTAIDVPGSYKSLWQANNAWQEFYDFIESNGYDELTWPSREDIQDDVNEAWTAESMTFASNEAAYKEGYHDGYQHGYTDGWNDAMNSIEEKYPNGN